MAANGCSSNGRIIEIIIIINIIIITIKKNIIHSVI